MERQGPWTRLETFGETVKTFSEGAGGAGAASCRAQESGDTVDFQVLTLRL